MTASSPALDVVRRRYPNALSTGETVDRLLDLMQQRLGLPPSKIMLGDSICSDDLNTIEYPPRAYEMLGPFKLGGLDGFPFAGLTGMSAFAHHVPGDGAIFLFHGPHIGISKAGDTGVILRPGQAHASSCCGAIRAAVDKLAAGRIVAGEVTELDYQQNKLEQILLPHRARILAARCAVAESTEVMYDAIQARIDVLAARTQYPCRHVVIMGGVLINSDFDAGSFCCFRRLTHIDQATGARDDWLPALLGGGTDHGGDSTDAPRRPTVASSVAPSAMAQPTPTS
jgi:Limiting CO2-inducible proteins B/C beta carbonyic anhydrases